MKKLLKDQGGKCGKCGCGAGCLAIVVVIILIVLVVKYFSGPSTQKVDAIPDNFPKTIPIYKAEQATKIEFSSDQDQNRLNRSLTVFGQYIASQFMSEEKRPKITKVEDGVKIEHEIKFSDIWAALKNPLLDEKYDHTTIEWNYLDDEFYEVKSFYVASFLDKDFEIKKGEASDTFYGLDFSQDKISGDLKIEHLENSDKIYIRMVADFPSPE